MLSSRRAMLRSMILRASANGSPAEHDVLVLSGGKTIGFLIWIFKVEKKHVVYFVTARVRVRVVFDFFFSHITILYLPIVNILWLSRTSIPATYSR
jgi:hypothetical protein